MPTNKFSHERLLRWPEVGRRTGKCRSAVRKMEAAGQFPRRIAIGPRAVAWLESEIAEWIAQRAAERSQPNR
ncbi:MAG: AlpA family phage regulatory protein [Acetobacteraceae bacterium]|nr:AlpA family phage regulatory protein [Acetobacteraceae bacterium]